MNRVSEARAIFREINEILLRAETANKVDRTRLLRSLRKLNEEMCDLVADLIQYNERNIRNSSNAGERPIWDRLDLFEDEEVRDCPGKSRSHQHPVATIQHA